MVLELVRTKQRVYLSTMYVEHFRKLMREVREGSQKSADPCNEKRVVKMELTAVKANIM